MDTYDATRIVFSRIQSLEPENVSKIIGYMLLQDLGDQEMIRLAFGPNDLLQSMVCKAKEELGLSSPPIHQVLSDHGPTSSGQYSHLVRNPNPYANGFHWGSHQKEVALLGQDLIHQSNFFPDEHGTEYLNLSRHQSLPHDLKFSEVFYSNERQYSHEAVYPEMSTTFFNRAKPGSNHRRAYSMTDVSPTCTESVISWKPCMYFARGYCKHGSNCRFSHSLPSSKDYEKLSMEKLEIEVYELLRGSRAPVSIASLPQLYYERFGKTLQAEGYLTESQRHGKTGYSLTNLLARLNNTIMLIDRPHGQHAIILAEDAYRFTSYRNHGNEDLGSYNPGSRQIYMTFPAESTFTEEDVQNYFEIYGPVQDVRIPYQQKRMFGFVTYRFPETVKLVLSKGNPHFVCGARVLVKPYKEKNKHGDRKYMDRGEHSRYPPSSYSLDMKEYDSHIVSRLLDSSEMMRRQKEEKEQALELERLRFSELNLVEGKKNQAGNHLNMALPPQNHFSNEISNGLLNVFSNDLLNAEEEIKVSEDLNVFDPTMDQFSYLLDVLDSEQNNEVGTKLKTESYDEGNNGHNLPDSPFSISNAFKTLSYPDKTNNLSLLNNSRQETSTSDFTQIPLWSRCS